jgi:hypothetical protein
MLSFVLIFFQKHPFSKKIKSFYNYLFIFLIHYINFRFIPMIHYKCCYLSKSKNFNTKLNYNINAPINVSTFV